MRNVLILWILISAHSMSSQDSISIHMPYYGISNMSNSAIDHYKIISDFNRINETISLKINNGYLFKYVGEARFEYEYPVEEYKELRTRAEIIHDLKDPEEDLFLWFKDSNVEPEKPEAFLKSTFNENDLIIQSSYSPWDGNYEDLDDIKFALTYRYFYNEANLLIRYESQSIYDLDSGIDASGVSLLSYDSLGLLDTSFIYSYDYALDSLLLHQMNYYLHDERGNLISQVREEYENDGSSIVIDSFSYVYNEDNLKIREYKFNWRTNRDVPGYDVIHIIRYNYNQEGQLITETKNYGWRIEEEEWGYGELKEYSYYEHGSINDILHSDSTDWRFGYERNYKIKYTYDHDVPIENVMYSRGLLRSGEFLNKHKRLLLKEEWFDSESAWQDWIYKSREYQYEDLRTTSTNEEQLSALTPQLILYPNPSSDIVQVSGLPSFGSCDVALYNLEGRCVLQQKMDNKLSFSLSELDSGVYYYKIRNKDSHYSGKVVKL